MLPGSILQSHTCLYQDQTWQLGDIVTGDPCDKCMCTQFGVMCSYQVCGELFCVDARQEEGECCKTCPNGESTTIKFNSWGP